MDFKKLQQNFNSSGIEEFLGLSPNDMHSILYHPADTFEDVVYFNKKTNIDLIKNTLVAKHIEKFLSMIGTKGVKATQNGNLPLKIVNEFHNDFTSKPSEMKYHAPSEDYCRQTLAFRKLIIKCGWVKKQHSKFLLTKKGEAILENGISQSEYLKFLNIWLFEYNWAFTDGYSACKLLQTSAFFCFYILHVKANETIYENDFVNLYLKAFPMVLDEINDNPYVSRKKDDELKSIIQLRFFERFCEYFGLAKIEEKEKIYPRHESNHKIIITDLFQELFIWFDPKKQHNTNENLN